MMSVTYWITCSSPEGDDDEGWCPADFEHQTWPHDDYGDPASLINELDKRGWLTVPSDGDTPRRFFCPLHREEAAAA